MAKKRIDHCVIRECVLRAVGRGEYTFKEIAQAVTNDYGSLSDRTIHRHLVELVDQGLLTCSGVSGKRLYSRRKQKRC